MEQQQLLLNFNSYPHDSKSSSNCQLLKQSTLFFNTQQNSNHQSYNSHVSNINQPAQSLQQPFPSSCFSFSLPLKENIGSVDSRKHEKSLQKVKLSKNYIKQSENKWEKQYPQTFDTHHISPDNVFERLQQNNLNQRKLSRNAFNRREIVALNLKLKNMLLSKYHLYEIPNTLVSQVRTKNDEKLCRIKKRKDAKLKELTIRKLHKILWKKVSIKGLQPQQKYKKTMKLIQEIQQAHGRQSPQFQKSFIQLIREISDNYVIKNSYLQNYQKSQSAFAQKSFIYDKNLSSKKDDFEKHESTSM